MVAADGIQRIGIIPAYAGSTVPQVLRNGVDSDHPRVCGEHQLDDHAGDCRRGSSPRMRGALLARVWSDSHLGIIPAYAGSTFRQRRSRA